MESTIPDYQMQEEAAVTSPDEILFLEEIGGGASEDERKGIGRRGWASVGAVAPARGS
jgi:hypothetical protein